MNKNDRDSTLSTVLEYEGLRQRGDELYWKGESPATSRFATHEVIVTPAGVVVENYTHRIEINVTAHVWSPIKLISKPFQYQIFQGEFQFSNLLAELAGNAIALHIITSTSKRDLLVPSPTANGYCVWVEVIERAIQKAIA